MADNNNVKKPVLLSLTAQGLVEVLASILLVSDVGDLPKILVMKSQGKYLLHLDAQVPDNIRSIVCDDDSTRPGSSKRTRSPSPSDDAASKRPAHDAGQQSGMADLVKAEAQFSHSTVSEQPLQSADSGLTRLPRTVGSPATDAAVSEAVARLAKLEVGTEEFLDAEGELLNRRLDQRWENDKAILRQIEGLSWMEKRKEFSRLKFEQAEEFKEVDLLRQRAETFVANGYSWGNSRGYETVQEADKRVKGDVDPTQDEYIPKLYPEPLWDQGNRQFEWDMREEARKAKDPAYKMRPYPPFNQCDPM
ncbi:hypothetical protein GGS24DRAFT_496208 [Hypoxylon argillaceum]|nr:hypothetical protein GGS24DRAFT_496208 [Hypoxylon argillaceum]